MFARKKQDPSRLTQAIDAIFDDMAGFTSDADEYEAMTDQLKKLYKLKAIDKPEHVCPDTLAIIAGNLIGIILILGYEQKNVITTKALMFVQKLR